MVFVHEYDERGNHRLKMQIFQKPDIVGEWASPHGPAVVTVPDGDLARTFAAHTDFDTRFPLVYEVKQIAETIIVTNCGKETWRGTADQASNRSAIIEVKSGPFYITDAIGAIVGGFDDEHQLVFTVATVAQAKRFDTREEALAWGKAHADCGYGFRLDFIVREIP